MEWKLWLKYLRARVRLIFRRTWVVVPLSQMAEAKERLGINLPINYETVRQTAETKDPFPCPMCGAQVPASSVEVTEISAYVLRSIRRGRCPNCGEEGELEQRFYEGQIAFKSEGQWQVALVVPSSIDRISNFFSR